jgi:hypothetical protein
MPLRRSAIEFLLEALVTLFFEVVVGVLGQLIVELGWRTLSGGFEGHRARQRAHPALKVAALSIAGVVLGGLSGLLLPDQLFESQGIRGATMVVSPLITGSLMEVYGRWCDRRGRERSFFATFWGGAIFAFSLAATRFYLVASGR